MDTARLVEILGERLVHELLTRRDQRFTGVVTLTVTMRQGGVLDARRRGQSPPFSRYFQS